MRKYQYEYNECPQCHGVKTKRALVCKSCRTKNQTDNPGNFWKKVNKDTTGGCWEWTGGTSVWGYGMMKFFGTRQRAHRISWILTYGKIPDGLFVLHKCDNKKCVRPEHLFLGTQLDNMHDMIAKGRKKIVSKLTREQVAEIRTLYASGTVTLKILSEKYHVCLSGIWAAINRTNWKSVP
jgi:hypothetical protein